ncbi:MAG: NAD+ kinase [Gammaproteobacteria bacterium]|jgi:NAD+ kinase
MDDGTQFKNIGLIVRTDMQSHIDSIHRVINILKNHGRVMLHCLDFGADTSGLPIVSMEELVDESDLVISLGGDGTLLSAARSLAGKSTPLLGINLGRLGFLADVPISDVESYLAEIIQGHYSKEKRFFVTAEVENINGQTQQNIALNDIILHSHKALRMIEYEVFCNGDLIYKQRSDGVIVATPTGSTAYALSGGGPIMHPALDTLALVPICPHTLSNRPIVLPADQIIDLRIGQDDMQAKLAFDGQDVLIVERINKIRISRSPKMLTLLHPKDYDYFKILRGKLNWSAQYK